MSDPTDSQVLLRLVIRGMSPDEVQRLAQQTYGQLKTEAAQHIDALTKYYQQSQASQDQAARDSADEKIKAETKALDAVTKLMRQQEIEANRARGAWHGVMEDLENITTVAEGAWKVMEGGFERFKSLGEDIAKTTNIYESLKGSIDDMRKATEGEVADIDLIEAKNRGFQESLRLTDHQYGEVAAAAHNFAKTLGVDTKEALDKLIQGLATGRVRTLEMVGVTVNADQANKEYAKSIGKTVDQLTDHDKKNAILQESLRAMDRKIVESGGTIRTFASEEEQLVARLTNMFHEGELALGRFVVNIVDDFTIHVPNAFKVAVAAAEDALHAIEHPIDTIRGRASSANLDATVAQIAQQYRDRANASNQEAVEAAKARLADPNAYAGASTGFGTDQVKGGRKSDDGKTYDALIAKLGKEQGAGANPQSQDEALDLKAMLTPQAGDNGTQTLDEYVKAAEAANAADEKRYITMEKVKGLAVDSAVAYQKLATSLGIETEQLTHEEKMQALQNEAMIQADKLAVEAKKKADARRAELKSTQDKAGFMGIFLWGTGGPDETYREMDEFEQRLVDTMGSVSNSLKAESEKMANAVGKSIGASIAGADAGSKSIKQQTHDALVALAEQAAGKAVWEGAEALASAAVGNEEGAGLHLAASAAYAGVAVTAGLSARAIGNTPAAKSAAGAGSSSGLSQSSSNSFGSGSRSSPTSADVAAPVTINMTVLPGGEAEAGRSVVRALTALQNQTGQSVQPLLASG